MYASLGDLLPVPHRSSPRLYATLKGLAPLRHHSLKYIAQRAGLAGFRAFASRTLAPRSSAEGPRDQVHRPTSAAGRRPVCKSVRHCPEERTDLIYDGRVSTNVLVSRSHNPVGL